MSPLTTAPASARELSTPRWAWAFVLACVAIPAVSLGGAIPGAIGGAGYRFARQPGTSTTRRVTICATITVACWTAFIAFVALLTAVL